jgi:5-methylcytosine-specific restriction endonuclease McrA
MTEWNASHIRQKKEFFEKWLSANGAQVLTPTNEWELVRFRDGGVTSVIYANKRDGVTFTGSARVAWDGYKTARPWRAATPKAKRQNKKDRDKYVETLRERDGDTCFFCAKPMDEVTESVEHLLAVTHGGAQHISNMFLAHKLCNEMASHLSVVEKIKRYHEARMQPVAADVSDPPWQIKEKA